MSKIYDLVGNRYGRLVVLSKSPERRACKSGRSKIVWKCLRHLFSTGRKAVKELAEAYRIPRQTINCVVRHRTWIGV